MQFTEEQEKAVNAVITAARIPKDKIETVKGLVLKMILGNLEGDDISTVPPKSVGSITLRVIAAVEKTKELIETPPDKWESKLLERVLAV